MKLYRCARCGLLTDAAGTRLSLAQAAALPAGWHDATLTDGECCRERVAVELAREFWAGVDDRIGPDDGAH